MPGAFVSWSGRPGKLEVDRIRSSIPKHSTGLASSADTESDPVLSTKTLAVARHLWPSRGKTPRRPPELRTQALLEPRRQVEPRDTWGGMPARSSGVVSQRQRSWTKAAELMLLVMGSLYQGGEGSKGASLFWSFQVWWLSGRGKGCLELG